MTSGHCFAVGDLAVHLTCGDARLALTNDELARPFLVADRRPDVRIRAIWTDEPIAPTGKLLFDGGHPWQLYADAAERLFTFRSAINEQRPYKSARFNADFSEGIVTLYRPHFEDQAAATIDPLDYPLDELLMIHFLSQGHGVAVHGCGLLDAGGRAYVFAGQSGAGKSTLARLCAGTPGLTLLSDERLIVRTDRPHPTVYGTPWHGDARFVSAASGPLAAILFLKQASAHALLPVAGALAAARLFSCAFLPFHDAAAVECTVGAVARATASAPCYELQFTPERSVVDLLTRFAGIVL